ncbi:MAG: UDP-N-acetylmuramate--L-alanine ligase [Fretibacterium sp.]|nr:UDP-N-acetylmuramate--L-alanine ligase [Fretibacterium sp.]
MKVKELEGLNRIHLMGIGGAGMSSLARLLSSMGYCVSGCDLARTSYLEGLESQGIECLLGHSSAHLKQFSPQLLVYSSAVPRDHEELVAASEQQIPIAGRGRALSWLFNAADGIGVAGAHGKTTTSSMIALLLQRAGLSPTLAIGAEVCDLGTNAALGEGRLFVAELDESDGSFEFFHPSVTVVTNVDWDHVNYFSSKEQVIEAFTRFVKGRKSGSPLIVCAEDEGVQSVLTRLPSASASEVIRCGWGKAWEWGAFDVEHLPGGGMLCRVCHQGQDLGRLRLAVSGEHNVLNALNACAVGAYLGVSFERAASALAGFKGARHRLQNLGQRDGVEVFDDYAHHPTEIEASLSALRGAYPGRRIIAVFQPHRYTRTAAFRDALALALEMADVVLLLPVYSAGEAPITGATSEAILERMKCPKERFLHCDEEAVCKRLESLLREGDLLLTLGAGSIAHLGPRFLAGSAESGASCE